MPKINPMAMAKPFEKEITIGRKVVAAVGHEHRFVNNNPVVDIRYVVIQDKSGSGDEGAAITDTFWLTERSMWRIAKLSMATGWCKSANDVFDPEISEELVPVYIHAPFEVEIIEKEGRDGKFRMEVSRHYPCNSVPDLSEAQQAMIARAEQSWQRMTAKSRGVSYGGSPSIGDADFDDDGSDLPF